MSTNDIFATIDAEGDEPGRCLTFPWPILNERAFRAIQVEDTVILLAGAGAGKTSMIVECIHHWISEGDKVAAILLEDTPQRAINRFLTVVTDKKLIKDHTLVDKATKKALWQEHYAERLFLEDAKITCKTPEDLINKIRYLATYREVGIVLVDPLSYVVTRTLKDRDERQAIDLIVTELTELARQLGIIIIATHHLTRPEGNKSHEEGAPVSMKHARGSNAIGMYAACVIGIEVTTEKDKAYPARRIVFRKSRIASELLNVPATYLIENPVTGRVTEVEVSEMGFGSTGLFDDGEAEGGNF